MKKINHILLAVFATLTFAPVASAQHSIADEIKDPKTNKSVEFPPETRIDYDFDTEAGVGFTKNVSKPLSDGTYYIMLETFATGSGEQTSSSTPSDIILVLDSSTSMYYVDYGSDNVYNKLPTKAYYYNRFSTTDNQWQYPSSGSGTQTNFYYKYEGNYYRVSRGGNSYGSNTRYLTFTVNGTPYYLNDRVNNGQPTTTQPNNVGPSGNNSGDVIWTGELYYYGQIMRIDALRNATNEFIDSIYENEQAVRQKDPAFKGNRIGIVHYNNAAYKLTSSYSWSNSNSQYANWFYINDSGVRDNLKNAVNTLSLNNWTQPGLGLRAAANDLLDGDPASKRSEANLTVLMFTDGVPCTGNANTFTDSNANQAIYWGYQMKQTYGATLFTVGLMDENSTDTNDIKGLYFLDLLSSNYPKSYTEAPSATNSSSWSESGGTVTVTNMTGIGANDKDPEGNYRQLVGPNQDLSSIFAAISQHASADANANLSSATSNVDVVSNSFILPEGVNAQTIKNYVKVFTAKLEEIDEDGNYVFYKEIMAPHSTDTYEVYDSSGNLIDEVDIDGTEANPTIGIELIGTHGIKVTGFDYAKNFCGPVIDKTDPEHPQTVWHGHKIMILIPIQMDPNAVGGPNVATNTKGSGLYISSEYNPDDPNSKPDVEFNIPSVSLPVNMFIEKIGLQPGESAKFRIERAFIPANGNISSIAPADWKYVSTVFVTNSRRNVGDIAAKHTDPTEQYPEGNPVVKVRGLPATDLNAQGKQQGLIYRITEENWGWSYTIDTTPQYTDTEHIENPFTFTNTPKARIDILVRHAESKVTNVFKDMGTDKENELIDDSKPRKTKTEEGGSN